MGWAQKPLTAHAAEPDAILVGFDLNATRARAVHGLCQVTPRPLPLEGSHEDLPMVLSLEGRRPHVGRAGASLCRLSPHLTCLDFLASLGERREWVVRRHRIDASRAAALVFERVQPACTGAKGIVLALPAYLTRAQAVLLGPLAEKAKLPLLGSLALPLACTFAAHSVEPLSGTALVLDADDHALTASLVVADGEQIWIHATQSWPQLNLRAWKGRLLDVVADRCIRQSRRDPRDSPSAEQSLYEQLEDALDASGQGRIVELLIQTTNWYQNLLIRPEEMMAACDRLVRQSVTEIRAMLTATPARDNLRVVLVTPGPGRLPGFVAALQEMVGELSPREEPDPSGDFGEDLLATSNGPVRVNVLGADAVARAAHHLAARIYRGELPHGHLDLALPLPQSDSQATPGKRTFRLFGAEPEP